jgi:hypothetical protein
MKDTFSGPHNPLLDISHSLYSSTERPFSRKVLVDGLMFNSLELNIKTLTNTHNLDILVIIKPIEYIISWYRAQILSGVCACVFKKRASIVEEGRRWNP